MKNLPSDVDISVSDHGFRSLKRGVLRAKLSASRRIPKRARGTRQPQLLIACLPACLPPPSSLTMEGVERSASLLESLELWADKTPDKVALTFLDDSGAAVGTPLTYGTLRRSVDALAVHLLGKLGLAKGSTCLLVYPPSLDFTVAFLACLRAGVIAVPCFPPDPKRLKKDLNMFAAIQGSSGATVALTNKMYNYAKKVCILEGVCLELCCAVCLCWGVLQEEVFAVKFCWFFVPEQVVKRAVTVELYSVALFSI